MLQARPEVNVDTTATPLFDTGKATGMVMLQNLGPNDVTVTDPSGTTNSVVVQAGGGSVTLDGVNGKLYGKTSVLQVAPANLRVLGDWD